MLETYQATLQGNFIEWGDEAPSVTKSDERLKVFVTILNSSQPASDGKAMAQALEKLAAANSLLEISDPVEWQREQRHERILLGRE